MSDAPIDPREYIAGVQVVDIGDLRVARGETRRPRSSCQHTNLVYDKKERRIWCPDCETEVEAFDAFMGIVEQFDGHIKRLKRREREVSEAEQFAARTRAVKALDKVWRSHHQTPVCPHCRDALLPEDFANGVTSTGRELARAARGKRQNNGRKG